MTTVVAWERTVGPLTEVIIASDSRFGGGQDWDSCAKIFDIGRDDAALAFAGDTQDALPLVFQAIATTRTYEGSKLRTLDLMDFSAHLTNVLNVVLEGKKGIASEDPPDCEFLLVGWSWKMGQFKAYRYTFDKNEWKFFRHKIRNKLPPSLRKKADGCAWLAYIGDGGPRLLGALARAYGTGEAGGLLEYRPLEALYQQTLDTSLEERTVGGPVQVVKVYRSIRVEHFATLTPQGKFVSGRPVLHYENIDLRTIERSDDGTWSTEIPRVHLTTAEIHSSTANP